VNTSSNSRLVGRLKSKTYRAAYVAERVRLGIVFQLQAMREQRNNMSQAELGELLEKSQSVVSRLENPCFYPRLGKIA
jgi:predicted XRE-type DNA-binding protein